MKILFVNFSTDLRIEKKGSLMFCNICCSVIYSEYLPQELGTPPVFVVDEQYVHPNSGVMCCP